METIAIFNPTTHRHFFRKVAISRLIDNHGNQFSQAVSKDGIVARLYSNEHGESYWEKV